MKVTDILILICISFSLYAWGDQSFNLAFSWTNLLQGEYYTLITGLFVHASTVHLGGNMVFLYIFGRILENEVGSLRFTAVFFVSGILSFILSIPFYPGSEMVGASAAIFAVMATMMLVRRPGFSYNFMSPFGPLALLYFIFNIIAIQDGNKGNVAYISHVIGFIIGLSFGTQWNPEWKRSLVYTLMLLGFYIILFYSLENYFQIKLNM